MNFYFRGLHILEYDPKWKDLTTPVDPDTGIPNFNKCKFIPADFAALAGFMNMCSQHAEGVDVKLEDVEVY